MKKLKMSRTIERGGQEYRGDDECIVDDSVADALIAEGHAYLLETVHEQTPATKEESKAVVSDRDTTSRVRSRRGIAKKLKVEEQAPAHTSRRHKK